MPPREVPEAVLFEILIRLPVKSLCRFRSVSTAWLSVISDPYFVRSHYALSETRPKLLLQVVSGSQGNSSWELLVSNEDDPEPVVTLKLLNYAHMGYYLTSRLVHGLICRNVAFDGLRITNPITQEHISIYPPTEIRRSRYDFHNYCFGFDPIADKHKVLYSFAAFDSPAQPAKLIEHWLFTLGSAEGWRRIGVLNSYRRKVDICGEVCINGVMYFVTYDSKYNCDHCLVSFDLKSETFQTVKVSSLPGKRPVWTYKLMEFNGSVALACRYLVDKVTHDYYPSGGVHLLVLEDFHKQVWKLERSAATPDLWLDTIDYQTICLSCAPRSGNLLVFTPHRRHMEPFSSYSLYFYEVRSNRFWSSEIRTPEGDAFAKSYSAEVCDHVESVVSPKGSPDLL